ncbi:hypothetical protein CLOM_g14132 [Closterium sp. NIES-68]|nr:hypothetical protein CLOM_g14132 [Closterium sp. NIES-68]GJP63776.1 hypothetical protein CLOP_g20821 [Closterium sp. NIES-67]
MISPRQPRTWWRWLPSLAALAVGAALPIAWLLLLAARSVSGPPQDRHLEHAERHVDDWDWDFWNSSSADAVCGSWPADYAARHAAIRQASAAAHAEHVKRHRRSGVFAWFAPPLPPRPYDPAVRFLTFEWLDGCGGFGDVLNGLMLAFVTAVLDGRALIVRHDCLPAAFLPGAIDWRPTEDVPFEPATVLNPPRSFWDGGLTREQPAAAVKEGGVVWVDLRNTRVDPETYFKALENATNIRTAANLGMLTYMATQANGSWAERFKALGMRLPYAVGCFLRFLLRPRVEVQELFHSMQQRLRASTGGDGSSSGSDNSSGSGSSGGDGRRVAVVGIHIRVQDEVVWAGDRGAPNELSAQDVDRLLENAKLWLDCAEQVEAFWLPTSLAVRWMVITNSAQLKAALKSRYPDKVITTDFVPRHSNVLASAKHGSVASNAFGAAIESGKQKEARMFQELITEWLLLSASDAYVISQSGYSHTAAFFSMRTMAIFEYNRCDPEQPTEATNMGADWSGI